MFSCFISSVMEAVSHRRKWCFEGKCRVYYANECYFSM